MNIGVDKNQFSGSHFQSNFRNHRIMVRNGHKLTPLVLPYGDYCEVTQAVEDTILRRGDRLKKMDLVGDIKVAVDRKNSIDEICGNICSSTKAHERFRDEVILAQKCGCKFYVLVEDEKVKNLDDLERWENPRAKKYFIKKARMAKGYNYSTPLPKQPPASGKTLAKALRTMMDKYGFEVVFTEPKYAGKKIVELLEKGKRKEGD